VKKNTRVRFLFPSFHYNEEYYKNPQEFRPERWDEEESKTIPAFALNGFNEGPRTCIGKHFAKL
jgi:cytochrome P450